MKDKALSQMLKEIRFSLSLSQAEMASTLGMKEQMYALYERGKYDKVKEVSIRRQKLLDKIELVKNKILIARGTGQGKISTSNDFVIQELENKNQQLQQQVMELQQKIIFLQEKLLIKPKKIIAQATSTKNRES